MLMLQAEQLGNIIAQAIKTVRGRGRERGGSRRGRARGRGRGRGNGRGRGGQKNINYIFHN